MDEYPQTRHVLDRRWSLSCFVTEIEENNLHDHNLLGRKSSLSCFVTENNLHVLDHEPSLSCFLLRLERTMCMCIIVVFISTEEV